jgi:hypothetical protein
VGGIYQEPKINNGCLEIDSNMNVLEKEPLKVGPRFSIALTLVIDKFIFAIGGLLVKNKTPTDAFEIFDT